ncbi:peptide/nickel transport system ATP-binding protein [Cryobacterium sp. CAN_C3]|uniref:dipeptide ABC transporter ATP-binding protein n=1 Tax=unclassified Cryobacterium TaxID=2649013 RepID=UPI0018C9C62F|nr:ABC transporter ATP-binding protein [Cryobacterium sp. CAN_C3]MEC5152952.1 peptide/nickel transport system ATP-binding protein [Cryobacterium sp. CAN_C3]
MTSITPTSTLSVRDLRVGSPFVELLHGISFDIAAGERVGLIGESGSGKSLTAISVMGLLPETLRATGTVRLNGLDTDLLTAAERRLNQLRGSTMAMVFQEPMTALNPLMRVGAQVAEIMMVHRTEKGRRQARERAVDLLAQVKLPNPTEAALAFPHQLSGGQRQRVMLAMAMANDPQLLLCDEPTTALDVTVQAGVLKLIGNLVADRGTALMLITHDIAVVAEVCQRVLVMYQGNIVEDGPVGRVLTAPQHPYTKNLIAASDLSWVDDRGRLHTVSMPVVATPFVPAAAAAPRRVEADAPPPMLPAHRAAHQRLEPGGPPVIFNEVAGAPVIRVRDLSRQYRRRGGDLFSPAPIVHGLRDVSFDVAEGQRFGVVGESGSGKSTLMRILCALDQPSSGTIDVLGQRIDIAAERQLRDFRSQVQIVFQDPMGSLDPRMTVRDIVAEPLRYVSRAEARARVEAQLAAVGLDADVMDRHPHQFSGGQRQRISIARALITRPRVLVADEAVSALDVSVRAQVLNLLADLVDEYQLTLVFVSHDLGVIRHLCDTVAVISDGRIVECGPTDNVYDHPLHPYTRQLVSATPSLDELARRVTA